MIQDGIEAVRRYREYEQLQNQEMEKCGQQQRMKRLPIIGMSANSDNATKECALDVGMDLFIGKPFIMRELQPLLDQLNIEKNIGF
jgi:CheY-like chemotaxis protein